MATSDLFISIKANSAPLEKAIEKAPTLALPKYLLNPTEENCLEALLEADKAEELGDTEEAERIRNSVKSAKRNHAYISETLMQSGMIQAIIDQKTKELTNTLVQQIFTNHS